MLAFGRTLIYVVEIEIEIEIIDRVIGSRALSVASSLLRSAATISTVR